MSEKRLPGASFGLASNSVAAQYATTSAGPDSQPADRDAIASELLRYRDGHSDDWADIIDMLTMHPEERRRVVRLLGEIQAG